MRSGSSSFSDFYGAKILSLTLSESTVSSAVARFVFVGSRFRPPLGYALGFSFFSVVAEGITLKIFMSIIVNALSWFASHRFDFTLIFSICEAS